MINLIPPKGRTTGRFEYWVRVCTVWSFLLAGVFIVASFLFVPSYVLIHSQIKALSIQAAEGGRDEVVYKEKEQIIQDINTIVGQLQKEEVQTDISEIIHAVNKAIHPGVTIARYEISREEMAIDAILIQGTASTREALATFKNTLERSALFETATVPISDLAREADLPFSITITLSAIKK